MLIHSARVSSTKAEVTEAFQKIYPKLNDLAVELQDENGPFKGNQVNELMFQKKSNPYPVINAKLAKNLFSDKLLMYCCMFAQFKKYNSREGCKQRSVKKR